MHDPIRDDLAAITAALEGERVHADEQRREQIDEQLARIAAARDALDAPTTPHLNEIPDDPNLPGISDADVKRAMRAGLPLVRRITQAPARRGHCRPLSAPRPRR